MSQLVMERDNLAHFPKVSLPDGFRIRTYQEGDETGIAIVFAAAGLGPDNAEAVRRDMVEKPCFLPGRIFVVEHQGRIVGTASAWIDDAFPGAGYLHMVGVLPECRGLKIGAALVAATVGYSSAEGFARQVLKTDDWREAALRLYIDLGYYPVYADDTHPERWRILAEKLDRTAILARAQDRRW